MVRNEGNLASYSAPCCNSCCIATHNVDNAGNYNAASLALGSRLALNLTIMYQLQCERAAPSILLSLYEHARSSAFPPRKVWVDRG